MEESNDIHVGDRSARTEALAAFREAFRLLYPDFTTHNFLQIKSNDWWSHEELASIQQPNEVYGRIKGWFMGVTAMPADLELKPDDIVCNSCMMSRGRGIWSH